MQCRFRLGRVFRSVFLSWGIVSVVKHAERTVYIISKPLFCKTDRIIIAVTVC